MTKEKLPYPDMAEVIRRRDFHGIAWIPTTVLRWINRRDYPDENQYRVLQQLWETHVINNSGATSSVHNPSYSQWRDIPLVEDPDDGLLPGDTEEVRPG